MTEVYIDMSSPKSQSEDVGTQKGLLDQFILFGDSITQQASSQELGFAFQPALQNGKLLQENQSFSYFSSPFFVPVVFFPFLCYCKSHLDGRRLDQSCFNSSGGARHSPPPVQYLLNCSSI